LGAFERDISPKREVVPHLSGSSFRQGVGVTLSDGAARPGERISPKRDNV